MSTIHRGDKHPKPGTPEFMAVIQNLEDSLYAVSGETDKQRREAAARHILKWMVVRDYWPLGTRCKVLKDWTVETVFPDGTDR